MLGKYELNNIYNEDSYKAIKIYQIKVLIVFIQIYHICFMLVLKMIKE